MEKIAAAIGVPNSALPLNYIYFNRLLDGNNLIEPSKIGFTRAALLQEYYYYDGEYIDVEIYALKRGDFV